MPTEQVVVPYNRVQVRVVQIIVKFILSVTAFSLLLNSMVQAKPATPVQVRIQTPVTLQAGLAAEFLVTAVMEFDAENVTVEVFTSKGSVFHSGELRWQGALIRGQEKQLRFSLTLPDNGYVKVIAKASGIGLPELAASSVYQLNSQLADKFKGPFVSTTSRKQGRGSYARGQAIREFPLD